MTDGNAGARSREQPLAVDTAGRASSTRAPRVPRHRSVLAYQLLFGLLLLAAWQLASGRLIREMFVSSPTAVARELVDLFVSGAIWIHLQTTLLEFGIGYLVGALCGIAVGAVLGRSAFISAVTQPYIMAFYSIPKVALAPLFIIWFGIGINSKIAMVASFTMFLVFVNTFFAIRSINEHFVNLARLMGASNITLLRRILLPSAAPGILLGLRTSIPYGMIGAVVGEFMASNRGLGFLIYSKSQLFDAAGMFAAIVVLVAIVVGLTQIVERLERRVARWVRVEETRVAL
jgi:NitT/TauT family transport system permease protein